MPHFVRILISTVCGIPEQKLRVVVPDVGGGFGGKLNVYAEEAIALAVARLGLRTASKVGRLDGVRTTRLRPTAVT